MSPTAQWGPRLAHLRQEGSALAPSGLPPRHTHKNAERAAPRPAGPRPRRLGHPEVGDNDRPAPRFSVLASELRRPLRPRHDAWRLHCFRLRPERGPDRVEGEGPGGVEGEGPGGLGLQPRASASYGPERTTAADSCSRRTQLPARAAPPPPLRTQPPPEPRPDARCAEAALRTRAPPAPLTPLSRGSG